MPSQTTVLKSATVGSYDRVQPRGTGPRTRLRAPTEFAESCHRSNGGGGCILRNPLRVARGPRTALIWPDERADLRGSATVVSLRSRRCWEAVVFCGALAARGSASLDLARRRADREVGDGRVLRLAGSVADDDAPSGLLSEPDRFEGLRVTVPIWLSLMSTELAALRSIPCRMRVGFVVNRSSPTICTRSPIRSMRAAHPSQSSSAMPSSMLMMGYFVIHSSYMSISSSVESMRRSLMRM